MSNKIIKMNNIPDGYEIDQKNSTIEKIVLVKKSIYPKDWEEHFIDNYIEGFYIEGEYAEHSFITNCGYQDKSVFKTKKQAQTSIAYAQLTQLMALPCYNGTWVPNWENKEQIKYCIVRWKNTIATNTIDSYLFGFLTFKSQEIRDIFLENHLNLIKQFYEL
jgi:hypothetical protein